MVSLFCLLLCLVRALLGALLSLKLLFERRYLSLEAQLQGVDGVRLPLELLLLLRLFGSSISLALRFLLLHDLLLDRAWRGSLAVFEEADLLV